MKKLSNRNGIATVTKILPPFGFLFVANFDKKDIRKFWKETNNLVEVYRSYIFHWDYGEESLKFFIRQVNMLYSTIKLTVEYSKKEVNFLDINIELIDSR